MWRPNSPSLAKPSAEGRTITAKVAVRCCLIKGIHEFVPNGAGGWLLPPAPRALRSLALQSFASRLDQHKCPTLASLMTSLNPNVRALLTYLAPKVRHNIAKDAALVP